MPAGAPLGNTNAATGTRWRNAIDKALKMKSKALGQEALVKIAGELIDKAGEGDMAALKELGDRLDGKAAQAINVGGQEGNPIQVTEVKITALTSDD